MFDVGFQEIMLIFVILLIVVGPERLPRLARTMGIWIGKARSIVASVKSEVEREIRVSELKQTLQQQVPTEEFKKLADQVKSINSDVQSTGKDVRSSIESAAESIADSASANTADTPASQPPSQPASTTIEKPPATKTSQASTETPSSATDKVSAE